MKLELAIQSFSKIVTSIKLVRVVASISMIAPKFSRDGARQVIQTAMTNSLANFVDMCDLFFILTDRGLK